MGKINFAKKAITKASPAAFLIFFGSAHAAFPSKNIEFVVTYASGGSSDIAARHFSNAASRHTDTNIIVQNRPGAGGIVGTDYVYNANPDGHIIQLARVAVLSVAPTIQDIPYDPNEFTYLGLISTDPFACVTGARSSYENIDDLAEEISNNPGSVTYNSSGVGSLNQFAALSLLESIGAEDPATAAIHVPSQGEGPALSAVAGGHIDFFCGNLAPMLPQLNSENVKALFVTSKERIEDIKDVPTASELGYPELENIVGWSGIIGPPNMPEEAVDYYNELLEKVSQDQDWIATVINAGSIPNIVIGKEFKEFSDEQRNNFHNLAERTGISK